MQSTCPHGRSLTKCIVPPLHVTAFAPTTALSALLMCRGRAERGAPGAQCGDVPSPSITATSLSCLIQWSFMPKAPKALDQQHFRGELVPAAAKFRRQGVNSGARRRAQVDASVMEWHLASPPPPPTPPLGRRAAADISMVTSRAPAIVALNENHRKQAP